MTEELRTILEQVCAIEGLDPSQGFIWRRSGSVWANASGAFAYGWNLILGRGSRDYHITARASKDPLIAARDLLNKRSGCRP